MTDCGIKINGQGDRTAVSITTTTFRVNDISTLVTAEAGGGREEREGGGGERARERNTQKIATGRDRERERGRVRGSNGEKGREVEGEGGGFFRLEKMLYCFKLNRPFTCGLDSEMEVNSNIRSHSWILF